MTAVATLPGAIEAAKVAREIALEDRKTGQAVKFSRRAYIDRAVRCTADNGLPSMELEWDTQQPERLRNLAPIRFAIGWGIGYATARAPDWIFHAATAAAHVMTTGIAFVAAAVMGSAFARQDAIDRFFLPVVNTIVARPRRRYLRRLEKMSDEELAQRDQRLAARKRRQKWLKFRLGLRVTRGRFALGGAQPWLFAGVSLIAGGLATKFGIPPAAANAIGGAARTFKEIGIAWQLGVTAFIASFQGLWPFIDDRLHLHRVWEWGLGKVPALRRIGLIRRPAYGVRLFTMSAVRLLDRATRSTLGRELVRPLDPNSTKKSRFRRTRSRIRIWLGVHPYKDTFKETGRRLSKRDVAHYLRRKRVRKLAELKPITPDLGEELEIPDLKRGNGKYGKFSVEHKRLGRKQAMLVADRMLSNFTAALEDAFPLDMPESVRLEIENAKLLIARRAVDFLGEIERDGRKKYIVIDDEGEAHLGLAEVIHQALVRVACAVPESKLDVSPDSLRSLDEDFLRVRDVIRRLRDNEKDRLAVLGTPGKAGYSTLGLGRDGKLRHLVDLSMIHDDRVIEDGDARYVHNPLAEILAGSLTYEQFREGRRPTHSERRSGQGGYALSARAIRRAEEQFNELRHAHLELGLSVPSSVYAKNVETKNGNETYKKSSASERLLEALWGSDDQRLISARRAASMTFRQAFHKGMSEDRKAAQRDLASILATATTTSRGLAPSAPALIRIAEILDRSDVEKADAILNLLTPDGRDVVSAARGVKGSLQRRMETALTTLSKAERQHYDSNQAPKVHEESLQAEVLRARQKATEMARSNPRPRLETLSSEGKSSVKPAIAAVKDVFERAGMSEERHTPLRRALTREVVRGTITLTSSQEGSKFALNGDDKAAHRAAVALFAHPHEVQKVIKQFDDQSASRVRNELNAILRNGQRALEALLPPETLDEARSKGGAYSSLLRAVVPDVVNLPPQVRVFNPSRKTVADITTTLLDYGIDVTEIAPHINNRISRNAASLNGHLRVSDKAAREAAGVVGARARREDALTMKAVHSTLEEALLCGTSTRFGGRVDPYLEDINELGPDGLSVPSGRHANDVIPGSSTPATHHIAVKDNLIKDFSVDSPYAHSI